MNNLSIPFKGNVYHYTFPARWDELTYDNLVYIAPRLSRWRKIYFTWVQALEDGDKQLATQIDDQLQTIRIELLLQLAGIKKRFWSRRNHAFFSMYPDELEDVLLETNFIFTELKRTTPPREYFKFKGNVFYAPSSVNILTGHEFHWLDHFFQQYLKGDRTALNYIVAILYRRRGVGATHNPLTRFFCGDIRETLNRNLLDRDAEHLGRLPLKHKLPVFLWWQSMRDMITRNNPAIFNQATEKKAQSQGWIPVFRAMAQNPLQFEAIGSMRLSMIMMELNALKQEQKEAERRMAKLKKR